MTDRVKISAAQIWGPAAVIVAILGVMLTVCTSTLNTAIGSQDRSIDRFIEDRREHSREETARIDKLVSDSVAIRKSAVKKANERIDDLQMSTYLIEMRASYNACKSRFDAARSNRNRRLPLVSKGGATLMVRINLRGSQETSSTRNEFELDMTHNGGSGDVGSDKRKAASRVVRMVKQRFDRVAIEVTAAKANIRTLFELAESGGRHAGMYTRLKRTATAYLKDLEGVESQIRDELEFLKKVEDKL